MTWFQLFVFISLSASFMGTFTEFGTMKFHYEKILVQLSFTLCRKNLIILLMKNTINYYVKILYNHVKVTIVNTI